MIAGGASLAPSRWSLPAYATEARIRSWCFANPFSLRASAFEDLSSDGTPQSAEFGVSKLALAVPGGSTDVMTILLGLEGGAVQGADEPVAAHAAVIKGGPGV